MPFLKDYSHDIFISYAHGDNDPELFEGGWVTKFVEMLEKSLRAQLHRSVEIAFDAGLSSSPSDEKLAEWAASSAVFLVVGSPKYILRESTQRELQVFSGGNFDQDRYLVIELLPLHKSHRYPSSISNKQPMRFYKSNVNSEPSTFSPGNPIFTDQVNFVGGKIADLLKAMKGSPISLVKTRAPELSHRRTVLLAQQAGDLGKEHREARQFFKDYGIKVLPEEEYPQGGQAFCDAFAADAKHADIFVQLLGAEPGPRPPDLRKGYLTTQVELAEAAKLQMMQWRSVEVIEQNITDKCHRDVLFGDHVRAEHLSDFLEAVRRFALQPPPPKLNVSRGKKLAYINFDSSDRDIGRRIAKKLQTDRLSVTLRAYSEKTRDNREHLETFMKRADAIFFVYGETSETWILDQYLLYLKCRETRDQHPEIVAICLAPPPDKTEHGVFDADVEDIELHMPDMAALLAVRDQLSK